MNAEEILTEVYWDLSTIDGDQIKYPDHDTLIKQLKKYMNSRYGIIVAKEGKMAGFFNEQALEWYKNNTDLLSVIDKLTARCGRLEEENIHLKDEVKAAVLREDIAKRNLEWRTHEVTDLNNCLARKNTTIKELKQKLTAINDIHALDFNAIFTSLGVNDTRSALDKIMEMKKLIKKNEEDSYLIDQQRKTDAKNYKNLQTAHDNLVDRYEELQASYDNCVNECSDHVIEIDSLLQNLEVKTVEEGIEAIRALKDGYVSVTYEYYTPTEKNLRAENERLKNFIKDRTNEIHEMSEEIEKCLAKYREEKDHD